MAEKTLTLLSSSKLKLSAPIPGQKGGRWATLGFDYYRNNPRIVVNTNDEALRNQDNNWGRITAALEPAVFSALIVCLERAIAAKEEWKVNLMNNNQAYSNGQRSQDITHETDVWIGRTGEGEIYISVVSVKPNFPKIKFTFGPADRRYHTFKHADGTEYTKAETSQLFARAYVRLLDIVMPTILMDNYEPPAPPQNKGGYGNRGGNNNYGGRSGGGNSGGSSGGSESKSKSNFDESDDDIPF